MKFDPQGHSIALGIARVAVDYDWCWSSAARVTSFMITLRVQAMFMLFATHFKETFDCLITSRSYRGFTFRTEEAEAREPIVVNAPGTDKETDRKLFSRQSLARPWFGASQSYWKFIRFALLYGTKVISRFTTLIIKMRWLRIWFRDRRKIFRRHFLFLVWLCFCCGNHCKA